MRKNNKKTIIITVLLIIMFILGIVWGVKRFSKKEEVKIQEISERDMQYFKIRKDNKYGVIGQNGDVIIEPQYNEIVIPNPSLDIFLCSNTDDVNTTEWKAFNSKKEQVLTEYKSIEPIEINQLTSIVPYEKTVLKYKDGNMYGLINFEGKKIVNADYEEIKNIDYKEGYLKVKKNGSYGVITIEGKKIIEADYNDIMSDGYYNDRTKYSKAGFLLQIKSDDGYKYGYADADGKEKIDSTYSELSRITEIEDEKNVYMISKSNGKRGLIKNGKQIVENEFDSISYDKTTNLLIVEKNTMYGIINLDGKQVIPIEFDSINIGGDYINATKGENKEVFDANGTKIDTNYSSHQKVSKNYNIIIDENNYYNITDSQNNVLLKDKYVYIEYFKNDLFIATQESSSGIINANGNVIVELKYSSIQKIEDTEILEATLLENNQIDLINASGKVLTGFANAKIEKTDKYIKLFSNNEAKYYDFNGNEKTYQELVSNNKIYAAKNNGKWGFVDNKGNVVVDYTYDMVTELNGNVAGIKKDGKWGVIDSSGKILLQPTYKIEWDNVKFLSTYYEISNVGETVYSSDVQE